MYNQTYGDSFSSYFEEFVASEYDRIISLGYCPIVRDVVPMLCGA